MMDGLYCYHSSCMNEATHEIWENEDDCILVCSEHVKRYTRVGEIVVNIDTKEVVSP